MKSKLLQSILSSLLIFLHAFFIFDAEVYGCDRFGTYLEKDFQRLGSSLNAKALAYTTVTLYGLSLLSYTEDAVQHGVQARYTGWRRTYLNIAKDKHWLTDVLGGAIIGGLTGFFLAKPHQRTRDDPTNPSSESAGIPIVHLNLRL